MSVGRVEEEEEAAGAQTAPAQLHNTPGSLLLLQGPHHLDFLVTLDLVVTNTSINILWVTHIFRSVLRSLRPAAQPA